MKNKSKHVFITKTHIIDKSEDELDIPFKEGFGFSYDNDDDFDVIEKRKSPGYSYADAFPIKIDHIISIFQKIKAKGATHVEMSYNCDHYGYDFSGYEIRKSTPEEIQEFVDAQNKMIEKHKKIEDLQKQIKQIKNE